jgi:hypothetical protein
MKKLLIMTLTLLVINPCYSIEKASEKRLDEVAQRGVYVMPFDLEQTTHVFFKAKKGGVQKVIVKNIKDTAQIRLIRKHLFKVSREFQQADYSDPAKIHGENMPGLEAIRNAKPDQISILYKDLPNGAEITYSTDIPIMITAIHQWFDAQLNDHARHATSGHASHKMHNKEGHQSHK